MFILLLYHAEASMLAHPWTDTRRLSENALFPYIFVKLEKIILGILTICLR